MGYESNDRGTLRIRRAAELGIRSLALLTLMVFVGRLEATEACQGGNAVEANGEHVGCIFTTPWTPQQRRQCFNTTILSNTTGRSCYICLKEPWATNVKKRGDWSGLSGSIQPCNPHSNGIIVEKPKPFDLRELETMLQARRNELELLRVIDGSKLTGASGAIQGASATSTGFSLTATEVSNPDATTAAAPSAPAQTSLAAPSSQSFGLNARDILSDQVSLTHEIINLSLLLNRAVSDRFNIERVEQVERVVDDPVASTLDTVAIMERDLVLLGFHIDLTPERQHRNRVAEIEITLKPDFDAKATKDCTDKQSEQIGDQKRTKMVCTLAMEDRPLSLAGLFPEKNTYNVATITKNATSVGLGAVVGVANVGVGGFRNRDTYYLVRDSDTISFRGRSDQEDGKSLVFGWQFRPVLGRSTVEPGPRQTFVLLSLANEEFRSIHDLAIDVKTCWRKLNPGTQAPEDRYEFCDATSSGKLRVAVQDVIDTSLLPEIRHAEWKEVGNGKVMISVEGANFDRISVLAGGKALTEPDGLRLSGSNRLSFLTNARSLTQEAFQVSGRYGNPVPIVSSALVDDVSIGEVVVTAVDSGKLARLELKNVSGLHHESRPVVEIGGEVITQLQRTLELDGIQSFETLIPTDLLFKDHEVTLIEPLQPSDRIARAKAELTHTDLFQVQDVISLIEGTKPRFAIRGNGFDPKRIKVVVGSKTFGDGEGEVKYTLSSPTLLLLELEKAELAGVSQLLLSQGAAPAMLVAIKPPAEEKDLEIAAGEVRQGDSVNITLKGKLASSVEKVLYEDRALNIVSREGATIQVRLSEAVTAKAGRRVITAVLKKEKAEDKETIKELVVEVLPPKTFTFGS